MSTIKLRQDFIDYFRKNGHKFMSPSKVFNDDPTLLFVNAGMNQLKDVFMGEREIKDEKYKKLTNSQICIRAGGKHNDLYDVGFDSYHLTSFEMLGNWSVNQYNKETAIKLAFNYLIDECHLNKDRIYVTYFSGSEGIPVDEESQKLWEKILPKERIIPGNFKDNFWMMAEYGVCGVCTEIHYDLKGNRDASSLVNQDDPEVIEIWNIVFIQYLRDETGFHKLDKLYIDTGMGLERLSMILQNKDTIYQTDVFRYLFGYAQALSNGEFFSDKYDKNMIDIAYRIFMDHIRTVVVSLFDGVQFGANKREFVLRKIFRRLLTYFYLYLNNCRVTYKMDHPLVKCMISDILNFYLKKRHDADDLWKQLIEEEKLFVGKITNVSKKYNKYMKQYNNREKVLEKLKQTEGIPLEIIENCSQLRFV